MLNTPARRADFCYSPAFKCCHSSRKRKRPCGGMDCRQQRAAVDQWLRFVRVRCLGVMVYALMQPIARSSPQHKRYSRSNCLRAPPKCALMHIHVRMVPQGSGGNCRGPGHRGIGRCRHWRLCSVADVSHRVDTNTRAVADCAAGMLRCEFNRKCCGRWWNGGPRA